MYDFYKDILNILDISTRFNNDALRLVIEKGFKIIWI